MEYEYENALKLSHGTIFSNLERSNPGFKVTPFFDAKYLRNGKRYDTIVCIQRAVKS